jgi:UDP-N-acetylglucosamine 4,6-dehydratase/5-epimerase
VDAEFAYGEKIGFASSLIISKHDRHSSWGATYSHPRRDTCRVALRKLIRMLTDKSILITGGTGSFGRAFVRTALDRYPGIRRIVVYSRDELKQYEMNQTFDHPSMRYFLGDVRDAARLRRAMEGIDIVVHAAALKQVPAAEYNPFEFIKTNVLGAQNLIESCLDASGVKVVIALSTDKAAAPVNLYGATKLCSDKLFIAANNVRGARDLRFSVVRYGNVMGSRGSVIPFFMRCKDSGMFPITDSAMTRFNISLTEGVEMVLWSIDRALGGEILVPKIPSYRVVDVASAIDPNCEQRVVGIRPGEKIHEEMITESDSQTTVDIGSYYAILPSSGSISLTDYCARMEGQQVALGFRYDSGTNPDFLTVEQLRTLIRQHVIEMIP